MTNRVEIDSDEQTISATRSLRPSGNSTVLTIPKQILEAVDFEEGDHLRIEADLVEGDEIRLQLDEG